MKVTVTCGDTSLCTDVPDDLLDSTIGPVNDARQNLAQGKIAAVFVDAYRTELRARSAASGRLTEAAP